MFTLQLLPLCVVTGGYCCAHCHLQASWFKQGWRRTGMPRLQAGSYAMSKILAANGWRQREGHGSRLGLPDGPV